MRYDEILSRAARIVWRRRYLWLLALFSGEGFGVSGSSGGTSSGSPGPQYPGGASLPDLGWVPYWLQDRLGLIVFGFVVLAGLLAVLFIAGCVCTGALIRAEAELDAGAPFTLKQAWRAGLAAFWRVLGLRLLVFALLLAPLLLLGASLGLVALNGRPLAAALIAIPFLLIYVVYLLAAGLLTLLATRAAVLEELGPVASLRRAARLLGQRFPRVIVTNLLTWAVGIGVGIVAAVVFAVVSIPFQAGAANALASGDLGRAVAAYATLIVVLIPVSVLLSAPVGAYYSTLWTVAYRRFDAEPSAPPAPALA